MIGFNCRGCGTYMHTQKMKKKRCLGKLCMREGKANEVRAWLVVWHGAWGVWMWCAHLRSMSDCVIVCRFIVVGVCVCCVLSPVASSIP